VEGASGYQEKDFSSEHDDEIETVQNGVAWGSQE
jgi:hypothetical protein